ncbi:MAG TPA: hypothetical protein EYG72_02530 [Candidatus Pacebacteria bacterium]|nr:hypothetical protein [Candidatus Paceibacterota bacterium]HIP34067.1 hypothetical protein [Bacteroidia bacterium]
MKKSLKGAHTTFIDEVEIIVKILEKNKIKYSSGIIKAGLKKAEKYLRIKKTDNNFYIICRDNISLQEIGIYARNISYEDLKNIILADKKIQKKIKKGFNVFTD